MFPASLHLPCKEQSSEIVALHLSSASRTFQLFRSVSQEAVPEDEMIRAGHGRRAEVHNG